MAVFCRKSRALDALDEIADEKSDKTKGKENKPWEPPSRRKSTASPNISRQSSIGESIKEEDSDVEMTERRKTRPKSPSGYTSLE